ncbi:MAG: hypothetical protein ACI30V_03965, partial [Muribaculaceae bacterium]
MVVRLFEALFLGYLHHLGVNLHQTKNKEIKSFSQEIFKTSLLMEISKIFSSKQTSGALLFTLEWLLINT